MVLRFARQPLKCSIEEIQEARAVWRQRAAPTVCSIRVRDTAGADRALCSAAMGVRRRHAIRRIRVRPVYTSGHNKHHPPGGRPALVSLGSRISLHNLGNLWLQCGVYSSHRLALTHTLADPHPLHHPVSCVHHVLLVATGNHQSAAVARIRSAVCGKHHPQSDLAWWTIGRRKCSSRPTARAVTPVAFASVGWLSTAAAGAGMRRRARFLSTG